MEKTLVGDPKLWRIMCQQPSVSQFYVWTAVGYIYVMGLIDSCRIYLCIE